MKLKKEIQRKKSRRAEKNNAYIKSNRRDKRKLMKPKPQNPEVKYIIVFIITFILPALSP